MSCRKDSFFNNNEECREPFKKTSDNLDWYDREPNLKNADLTDTCSRDECKANWIEKIKNYCGTDGYGEAANYSTAPGKDDPACQGLRKQPETDNHRTLAGIECTSGDFMCDSMMTTTGMKRQHNDCWWVQTKDIGQFRLPHSDACLGFFDCSINLEDSEIILEDSARATIEASCFKGDDGGGVDAHDLEDEICKHSLKCQIKNAWKKMVAKIKHRLPKHLQSKAEVFLIVLVCGILGIVVIMVVEQNQYSRNRFNDMEYVISRQRQQQRMMQQQQRMFSDKIKQLESKPTV